MSTAAIRVWAASVTTSTTRAMLDTSPRASVRVSVCVIMRARRRGERLTIRPSRVAAVIMPKPPIWNSSMIVACPKVDQ